MGERNFRPINAKCCGSCAELKDDDMSGNYYCDFEEDADFDPQEGQEWQYVCNYWRKIKRKIGKQNGKKNNQSTDNNIQK